MHSLTYLGIDLSGQLCSTASTLLYPSDCRAVHYIFEQNNNSQRKYCSICPASNQLTNKRCKRGKGKVFPLQARCGPDGG